MLLYLFVAYILGLVSGALIMALLAGLSQSEQEYQRLLDEYLEQKANTESG